MGIKQTILIGCYLGAIIVANLLVGKYGSMVVIPIGFLLVGFDITTRDTLHELWVTKRWLKMATI